MPVEMIEKIEDVLAKVVDPSTNLSVSQLGVVKRLTYREESNRLYVYKDFAGTNHKCMVCASMLGMQETSLIDRVRQQLAAAFPLLTVIVA